MIEWLPTSEDQLRDALDQGILTERHTLDFKRELPSGRGENKELARDLAQFAVDGGVLIIGVDDNAHLTPVDFRGLRERIDQVARDLIDEPLHVRIETIPGADPREGYLLVTVPPSPTAPHQVDGRYYGRGDTTKHVLPDAEVQRLHQLALRRQRDAEDLLDAEVRRDPFPVERGRQHAHLFGIAQPVSARPDLLQQVLRDPTGWHSFIHGKVRSGPAGQPLGDDASPDGWAPDLPQLSDISRRAQGWALSAPGIQPGRRLLPESDGTNLAAAEHRLLDLEIGEDGGLRLFCGRASDDLSSSYHRQSGIEVVFESLILGLTKRLVLIATAVAETTDYLGRWDFGIAVTGLRGLVSWRLVQRGDTWVAAPFSEDDYRRTVRVTYERLAKEPDSIVEDLTGQLNRALGGAAPVPHPPGQGSST